jgi:hypothetical protein
VTKLNPAGAALVYSTYLGGSGVDVGFGIALDGAGNAYVTGETNSIDFPATAGAFQTTFGGVLDAFVTKLNPTGSALVYSTYLGGNDTDQGLGIAVDAGGNAYVLGSTSSTNFPTTAGAPQPTFGGVLDASVTKLNPAGSALVYSTYLGGSSDDFPGGIALDAAGNAYVTGYTLSPDFPTTAGAFQTTPSGPGFVNAFVAKLVDAVGLPGRMTGAGGAFTADGRSVAHTFNLDCGAPAEGPNRLQVNWGGNRFELDAVQTAICTDDPAVGPGRPRAGFDTYRGAGTGRYNGAPGATAEWTFTDAGEPGRNDRVKIVIKDAGGATVLTLDSTLQRGNHQAHR